MSKSQEIAQDIKNTADRLGWNLHPSGCVLKITKKFTPGDMDAFVQADGEYFSILGQIPQTQPGSVWGTDGGGVGGYSAHKNGFMVMHKSGCSKRVINALKKII